jgi:hypothetical protein
MNDSTPEQIDAGARFLAEFGKKYPIKVGFWLREADKPFSYLYAVSDQIDEANYRDAYGEVLRVSQVMQDPYFDPFRVKLRYFLTMLAPAEVGRP